jgi:DNA-binding Lrp family transcriptional regulator
LKYVELKLLCELLRNSRTSDRELARLIGVSQPTVTRTRVKLEKEGVIEYGGVPNLGKLGFEILALTFAKEKSEGYHDTNVPNAKRFINDHPNLIFVSTGRGSISDHIVVSVHKNYSDYARCMHEIKEGWAKNMTITDSFIISLITDNVLRTITFKYLADCLESEIQEKRPKQMP